MNTIIEFKKEFEREMLIRIIIGLKYGKLSNDQAQLLSKEYLEASGYETVESMLAKLYSLIEKYSDILEVYIQLANKYFTAKKEQILTQAREYMSVQQYDVALTVLKGGVPVDRQVN